MLALTGRRIRAAALLAAVAFTAAVPASAVADDDTTAPTGHIELWAYDATTVTFDLVASDANGIAGVRLSCDDGATWIERAFASRLVVPLRETGLGCVGYENDFSRWVSVEVRDPSGNALTGGGYIPLGPTLDVEMPLPAITGHPFTVTPILPDDYTIPAPGGCRWEFRWGDTRSLDTQDHDETYASLLFDIPAVDGKCAPWTFTLPWVPVRQYEVILAPFTIESDHGMSFGVSVTKRFTATVDSTNPRIVSSTLPMAQVLPSTYTPIVGRPVTYTRYLIGGASNCCSPRWFAWQGDGDHPTTWTQNGGATFTLTPHKPGNVSVEWDRASGDWRLGALYDPPVRYLDTTRPNTTAPVQRIGSGQFGPHVPVSLTWGGTDRGWGIKSYKLQQSVNGGPWRTVALPTAKTKTIVRIVPLGVTMRYRVRATDKAGNVGFWDYGPSFRPRPYGGQNANITYNGSWARVADLTAAGGEVNEATGRGSRATFSLRGRDVAWIAERGPTHGTAKVYVDGVYRTTIDLSAVADSPRRIVYRRHWSTLGRHTLRIVVNGTGVVDIDGFIVLK